MIKQYYSHGIYLFGNDVEYRNEMDYIEVKTTRSEKIVE